MCAVHCFGSGSCTRSPDEGSPSPARRLLVRERIGCDDGGRWYPVAADPWYGRISERRSAHPPVVQLSEEQRRRLGLRPSSRRTGDDARLTGARAKQSGRAFEQEIEEANAFYERRGTAVVYRHHPPVEGWGSTLRVVGRGPADFSGVVRLRTGASMAVAFDCKVITGDASYAHAARDRHQLESLLRFREAGGRAFLLLRCRELDRVWMLEDLDALTRGERVPVRSIVGSVVRHRLPVLEPSPLLDIARGRTPYWDYVSLLYSPTLG